MPTVNIVNGNVVRLVVNPGAAALTLDMSLQRHHYRYCGTGAALAANSLIYSAITDAQVLTDADEIGGEIEDMLKKRASFSQLFGKALRAKSSKRVYLIDNAGLAPNAPPNHFFVTTGPSVWDSMSQNEFVAASALRRLEEAIAAKHDGKNYLDAKELFRIRGSQGMNNPVIAAYQAANTALINVPLTTDPKLVSVSNCPEMVERARKLY